MKGPRKPPPLKLPKPPWKSENMRDVAAMKAWVKERLEVRQSERFNKLYEELKAHGGVEIEENGPVTVVQYKWKELIDMAYEATEKNEAPIEPLREAVRKPIPELADFIHPRKRAVGEREFTRYPIDFRMKAAVEDVHFIRQLWKREYNGRWKRREANRNTEGNPPYAHEIAAEFHNVDSRAVKSQAGKNFTRKSTI